MTVPATKILVGLLAFLVIATYHQSEIFPNKHTMQSSCPLLFLLELQLWYTTMCVIEVRHSNNNNNNNNKIIIIIIIIIIMIKDNNNNNNNNNNSNN